jgi:hypothetical protein
MELGLPNRIILCPGCEEPLPHGRLSCPRCGRLLASVAGAYRAPVGATPDRSAVGADVSSSGPHRVAAGIQAGLEGDLDDASEPLPAHDPHPGTQSPPSRAPEPHVLPSDPLPPMTSPAPPADEVVPAGAPADVDDVSEPAPPDVDVPAEASASRAKGAHSADVPDAAPWPSLHAASVRRMPATEAIDPPAPGLRKVREAVTAPGLAGAYVPPTEPVAPLTEPVALVPRSLARHEPGDRGEAAPASTLYPSGTTPVTAVSIPSASRPARSLLADLPFRVPDDAAGRVVAAASAVGALGFLLPWTDAPVLGRAGYTAQWGFAASSYVVPWLLAVGILVVTLLPDRVPGSVQSGTLPLTVGALLLGLAWPHLLGSAGLHVGSLLVAGAALALIPAGLATRGSARRGVAAPPV